MEGIWAIVNTNGVCLEIYEGDILQFDVTKYSDYGGEIKVSSPWEHREAVVGKTFNHELDKFE